MILVDVKITVSVTALAMVLAEPGRAPTSTSYMWLFRRGDPQRPALVYQYHPTRAGDVARTFLGDYQGTVQTDLLPAKKLNGLSKVQMPFL